MVMIYNGAFDASHNAGTIRLATAGEGVDAVVQLGSLTSASVDSTLAASSIFWHYNRYSTFSAVGQDQAATSKLPNYSRAHFASVVQTALRAALTTSTWTNPSNLTVTFQYATSPATYTIAWPEATFTVSWSDSYWRQVFGFAADQSTPALTHTGTICPTYIYTPTLQAVSDNTPNFEPDGIGNHAETDGGQGFGLTRTVTPLYRDWRQEFETKELTMRANASSTYPWTMQHLFEHCRGQYAFIVADGFGESFDEAFSFRTEGIPWRPQRHTPGNDAQFFHDFKCSVEGTITTY